MRCLDVVAWVHIEDKRLLCARTRGNDIFYLPGGKREIGESDWTALSREVLEEVGVDLIQSTVQELVTIKEKAHGHGLQTWVSMKCFLADAIGRPNASAEIEEIVWMKYADRIRCAPATQRVIEYLFEQRLID